MKRKVFFLLGIFFLIFLFFSQITNVDWSLLSLFSAVDVLMVVVSLALETALYTGMIYLLIRGFLYSPKIVDLYLVLTTCLTANYATPFKVGVPLRVFLYKEKLGIPVVDGTSIILVEIFLNVFVSLFLSFIGLSFVVDIAGINSGVCLFLVMFFSILFFLIRFDKAEAFFAKGAFWFSSFFMRCCSFAHQVRTSLLSISFVSFFPVLFLYFFVFLVQAARLFLILLIFGHTVSLDTLLFVLAISTSIGTLSMIPMGIGVKDASFTFLLVQLGVPADTAVVVAAIQRLFSPGWPLLLGIISANILGVSALLKEKTS